MIDWNHDGRADPAEAVLTALVLGEPEEAEEDALTEGREAVIPERKESLITRLFRRRKDV